MFRRLVVDNISTKSCIHPFGREAIGEDLSHVHSSGVFTRERRDKLSRLTLWRSLARRTHRVTKRTIVGHHMHAAGWEDRRHAWAEAGSYRVRAILFLHPGRGVAHDGHDPVGSARVIVGR